MRNFVLALLSIVILAGCSKQPELTTINVATFNMRYDNPDDSLNNWQYRKERIAQFIKDQKVEIVGTQELLQNQVDDLKALLPEYDMVGVARDNGKDEGEYAAIFYLRDRFDALDSNNFWLCENPDSVGMKGWDAACTRIATWAKMQDKATGKIFMAVNTHFDHVGEVARRESALLIISKIKEIVGDRPAFLTGDFNVDSTSNAYETITTNEFVLNDSRKVAKTVEGADYTWHDFGKLPAEERGIIDFIFTTPSIEVLKVYIPQENADALLSDHNPQVATLQF
ncbi:MAG: endonuclease/exonuclease/phosphatase family protein [Muribaculaceae bacterium]